MIELPGYTIEKQLGRGGMARVYLARHIGLDRLVAIKVLAKDLDGDQSFSERFIREARIVASLNHQNIITVHDVGVHNEYHYIAMEYLPGETLDDKIKKKLDIQQILSITRQIASALDFAHRKDIVHRDVKPDNILFREDGTAVLTDFGIARATKSETRMTATGTVIGTPHYMSPEQAQGMEIGPWSDLYSLGIVLFEMLSGEVPFDADSTIAVVFKHITEPVPDLVEPYTSYQPLVNTLLAKEPGARYQTGREVIADIECLDRGDTPANATLIFNQTAINPVTSTTTQPASPTPATTKKSPDSKLKTFSAIAISILIATGTTLILLYKSDDKPDNTVASQQALDLAYEKQELEKRQRNLDEQEAINSLLEHQRLEKEKLDQETARKAALKREHDKRLAREQKEKAETEARRARQELQALKQKQLALKTRIAPAEKPLTVNKPPTAKPEKIVPRPVVTKKTGLLSGWLGDVDDNANAYINDLFKAADNALSSKHYASARQNYEKILQQEPDNKRAHQGLAQIKQQTTSNLATGNDAYTLDLLKAANNALSSNRLSSASHNYQKVLQRVPENKQALAGLNKVFDKHLQTAIEEAMDDDFDDAREHFLAAKKLKPGHKKLGAVSREIEQIQNTR